MLSKKILFALISISFLFGCIHSNKANKEFDCDEKLIVLKPFPSSFIVVNKITLETKNGWCEFPYGAMTQKIRFEEGKEKERMIMDEAGVQVEYWRLDKKDGLYIKNGDTIEKPLAIKRDDTLLFYKFLTFFKQGNADSLNQNYTGQIGKISLMNY